jgi:hypothetical protein
MQADADSAAAKNKQPAAAPAQRQSLHRTDGCLKKYQF